MFEDLVKYWKEAGISLKEEKDSYIHPKDEAIKEYENGQQIDYPIYLHTDLYPEPYNGDLSNPKIVFLYLNPGFNEQDYEVKMIMRQKLINALNQDFDNNEEYPFCWLDEEYKDKPKDENPGAFYWNKLFDQKNKGNSFLENLAKDEEFNRKHVDTRKWLAHHVCDIELFPYHSKTFTGKKAEKLTNICESSKIAKTAVMDAIDKHKEIMFVFMRSIKLWIPDEKERNRILNSSNVILNPYPQNPTLNPNTTKDFGIILLTFLTEQGGSN